MEAAFKGVSDVVSGYSGGSAATADYEWSVPERRGMLRQVSPTISADLPWVSF